MARGSSDRSPLTRLKMDLETGFRPFYLIFCKDPWWHGEAISLIKAKQAEEGEASFEYRHIKHGASWVDTDALLRNYSMFESQKVVHLDIPGKLTEEYRDGLRDFLDEEPGRNVLVITAPNQEQLRAAKNRVEKKGGLVLTFGEMKDGELAAWTSARLREKGLSFDADIPGALLALLPPEPWEVASEIDKLVLAVGYGARLKMEDLERVVTPRADMTIWRLTNALYPGNEIGILKVLGEFLDSGQHKPVSLLPLLASTVLNLMKARALLDEGLGTSGAAARMEGKAYFNTRVVEKAKSATRSFLLTWILNLQKLDERLKRTPEDRSRALMEAYILESMAGRILPQ